MITEQNLKKWIIVLPIIGVLFTACAITSLYLLKLKSHYNNQIVTLSKNEKTHLKKLMKMRIDLLVQLLDKNFELDNHHHTKYIIEKNKKILNDTLFDNKNYIFAYDLKGNTISHIKKELVGTNRIDLKVNNRYLVKESISNPHKEEGFFMEYTASLNPNKNQSREKISYVKALKNVDWVIGTGVYLDDYKKNLQLVEKNINKETSDVVELTLYIFGFVILFGLLIMRSLSNKVYEIFSFYQKKVLRKNEELEIKVDKRTKEQKSLLSLFDHNDASIYKWNFRKNRFQYVSSSVEKMFEYSKEDFVSGSIDYSSCIHKEDIIQYKKEYKKALVDKVSYFEHAPYRVISKNNSIKWIRDYKLIVRDKKERLEYIIGYITDITHLKKQESLAIENKKMLAIKELLHNIAHQWRQPLSAISTSASGLKLSHELGMLTDDLVEQYSSGITYNCKYLSKTIDNFTNLSLYMKEDTTIHIKEILMQKLQLLECNTLPNNIKIIENINQNLTYWGSQQYFIQSIMHIVNNSVDALIVHNKSDFKYIFIDAYCSKKELIINIKDNAGGISSDNLSKIFEPYFTTKHQSLGSGMDLYITKTIINNMNGEVNVSNVEYIYDERSQKGALFCIKLPINSSH